MGFHHAAGRIPTQETRKFFVRYCKVLIQCLEFDVSVEIETSKGLEKT